MSLRRKLLRYRCLTARYRVTEVPPRLGTLALLGFTALADVLPPRVRFGKWQNFVRFLRLRQGLPRVTASAEGVGEARENGLYTSNLQPVPAAEASLAVAERQSCLIVAGSLGTGGIETVVASLACGLDRFGFDVRVVCSAWGSVADDLTTRGASVRLVSTPDLASFICREKPDVVQYHRIDPNTIDALLVAGKPTVGVFHAIESYINPSTWSRLNLLLQRNPYAIAVSQAVEEYTRMQLKSSPRISVVVNGFTLSKMRRHPTREFARRVLSDSLNLESLDSDLVVLSLMRYSDQKNAPGLVDAFLRAVEMRRELRLVVAGPTDSWLEVRRADCLRRSHMLGDRVHLLGESDAQILLRAADIFALDSYAEGGPVAAVEAAAAGLPLVLSDVGFVRELVGSDPVKGIVVSRANLGLDAVSIAAQRRKLHQGNREEFARALAQVQVSSPYSMDFQMRVPERFTEAAMLSGHAAVLNAAIQA